MIRVVVDDLAFVAADAIVRPATTRLEPTTSSLRTLEQVGGPAFTRELTVQEDLAVGAAVVTGAGDLSAEFVIHAVITGPAEPVSREGVRRALTSALQQAGAWQLERLAVPPVGVGPGNLTLEDAADALGDVLRVTQRTAAFPQNVTIVVDNEADRAVLEARLRPLLNTHTP